MTIKILTDSTCDLPENVLEELAISVIPLYVNLNGKSYRDTTDLSRADFYAALPYADPHPTTAAPSPAQFMQYYDKLADEGASAVFSIHIASSLSAVFSSAESAAKEYTRIPIHAIDSGNLSMALGIIVMKAALAAREGGTEADTQALLDEIIPRTFAMAKLDTIDYLLRGGRISAIQHRIVGLLGIIPILKMNNYVSKMDVARTKLRAFDKILSVAKDVIPHAEIFGITHADAEDQVERLLDALKISFPTLDTPLVYEANPALGSHVGPGTLCINWLEKDQPEKKGIHRWFF